MSKKIAKSPEVLLKEAKIKELQALLKKRQTTLKSLKTRLKNMQTDISEISRRTQTEVYDRMVKMDTLRKEVANLAKQLKKVKGMSEEDKEQLQIMAEELMAEDLFGEGEEAFHKYREERENPKFDFDENYRAKMKDVFEEFRVKPAEKEQKDIRKVFIKLSNKFHPDRAKSEKEEKTFHSMMLQINEAYQSGDIQVLLELERLCFSEDLDLNEVKELTVDVLQKEIDRLEKEVEFIDSQVNRTSDEIGNLRSSDLGSMLSGVKKAERHGGGMDAMTEGFDEAIVMLERLKEGFEDSIKIGALYPILQEILMGQVGGMFDDGLFDGVDDDEFDEEDMNAFMEMLSGGGFQGNAGFGGTVKNPKFEVGSSVCVKKPVKSEVMPGLNMKDWEGRVVNTHISIGGKEVYEVEFDSVTLGQIPLKNLREAIYEMEVFDEHDFSANELEKSKPRDKEQDTLIAYRTLLHTYSWDHVEDAKQRKRLQKILLKKPEKTDIENWEAYLIRNLKFPFEAVGKGCLVDGLPEAEYVTIESLLGYNKEVGLIVGGDFDGQKISYPMFDLTTETESDKLYEVLDDYYEWAFMNFDI